jgi:hypothetical protein
MYSLIESLDAGGALCPCSEEQGDVGPANVPSSEVCSQGLEEQTGERRGSVAEAAAASRLTTKRLPCESQNAAACGDSGDVEEEEEEEVEVGVPRLPPVLALLKLEFPGLDGAALNRAIKRRRLVVWGWKTLQRSKVAEDKGKAEAQLQVEHQAQHQVEHQAQRKAKNW